MVTSGGVGLAFFDEIQLPCGEFEHLASTLETDPVLHTAAESVEGAESVVHIVFTLIPAELPAHAPFGFHKITSDLVLGFRSVEEEIEAVCVVEATVHARTVGGKMFRAHGGVHGNPRREWDRIRPCGKLITAGLVFFDERKDGGGRDFAIIQHVGTQQTNA